MSISNKKITNTFPPITTEEWVEKINIDLNNNQYKNLIWNTNEKFKIKPFYREEDLNDTKTQSLLNSVNTKTKDNSWLIRQDITVSNIASTNKKILRLIKNGVTSIGLIFENNKPTEENISLLLNKIPTNTEINFILKKEIISSTKIVSKFFIENNFTNGSIFFDPLTDLLKTDLTYSKNITKNIIEIVKNTTKSPNLKTITIQGDTFGNAGATITQQLGFLIAAGNEYMSILTDNNIPANTANEKIKFQISIGSNYFFEIAKIRALRILWNIIAKEYGCSDICKTNIYAITSNLNKTIYDSQTNIIRSQAEAMSAVIGGIDSLKINSFDIINHKPTDFSERIARNQQLLLKEEAFFDKVIDSSAGSYYIETLTNNIIQQAWDIFTDIEKQGGFISTIKNGFIKNNIKKSALNAIQRINTGDDISLGVNLFINTNEKVNNITLSNLNIDNFNPFNFHNITGDLEFLRYKTSIYIQKQKQPKVLILSQTKSNCNNIYNFFKNTLFIVKKELFNKESDIKNIFIEAKNTQPDIIVICNTNNITIDIEKFIYDKKLIIITNKINTQIHKQIYNIDTNNIVKALVPIYKKLGIL